MMIIYIRFKSSLSRICQKYTYVNLLSLTNIKRLKRIVHDPSVQTGPDILQTIIYTIQKGYPQQPQRTNIYRTTKEDGKLAQ